MQRLLGDIRRADEKYGLIRENGSVCLGLSGGKDSQALLLLLSRYRLIKPFSLCAVHVMSRESDAKPLQTLCDKEGVPFYLMPNALSYEDETLKNPCALCARLRRGILVKAAKEHGCDALALAHHADDAAETLLMSIADEGRLHTMAPKALMAREGIEVIRPLILTREKDIVRMCQKEHLTPVKNACPYAGHTERSDIKSLLSDIESKKPGFTDRLSDALDRCGYLKNINESNES